MATRSLFLQDKAEEPSRRSYKEAWDPKRACDEIVRCSGTQFDPRVVEAFVAAYDEIDAARRQYADERMATNAA